jgi:hypothetical protein
LSFSIEAIGRESIAILAQGSSAVIVSAPRPLIFVLIAGVTTLGDDASGVEMGIGSVKEDLKAETSVTSYGIDHQIRIILA